MEKLSTSYREISIAETWNRVSSYGQSVGITRVADITGLDTIGIPIFQAIRPNTFYPISVFAGKGLSPLESKVSACMEALESFVVEHVSINYKSELRGSYNDLADKRIPVLSLEDLNLPRNIQNKNTRFNWIKVFKLDLESLRNRKNYEYAYVPQELVLMPCEHQMFMCHTNGIASGNTLEEALLHAILEVCERDAHSLALVSRETKEVDNLYMQNKVINNLVLSIGSSGCDLFIKDITNDLEIPTYYAIIRDPQMKELWFYNGGAGAHVDPIIAIIRAITEAIQARVCMISGTREDLRKEKIKQHLPLNEFERIFSYWFSHGAQPSSTYIIPSFENVKDALHWLIDNLRKKNFSLYWLDYSTSTIPFKVVRVLIPELECFVIDKTRVGRRLSNKEPFLNHIT